MASYNCGEGRVIRTIARQGTKDYWKLRLPRETRNYVPKFMAVMTISRNLERYGFTMPADNPLRFDTVHLPGAVDLKAVASNVGVSLDSLKVLNPGFRKFAAPPDRSGISTVRVPEGTGDQLVAGLTEGTVVLPRMIMPREPQYQRHRVRSGQTLGAIARRYGVSTRRLAQINKIRNIHRLRVGQVLMVPDRVGITYAKDAPTPKAIQKYAEKTASSDRTFSGTKTIRIKRGDTLIGLANRYGTDVATLRALNQLRPRQNIIAGAKLKVPVR